MVGPNRDVKAHWPSGVVRTAKGDPGNATCCSKAREVWPVAAEAPISAPTTAMPAARTRTTARGLIADDLSVASLRRQHARPCKMAICHRATHFQVFDAHDGEAPDKNCFNPLLKPCRNALSRSRPGDRASAAAASSAPIEEPIWRRANDFGRHRGAIAMPSSCHHAAALMCLDAGCGRPDQGAPPARAEGGNGKSRRGLPDQSVNEGCCSSSQWPPCMRADTRSVCTPAFVDGSPLAGPNSRLQPIRVSLPFCQHRVTGSGR
jgi:hypothetical protein